MSSEFNSSAAWLTVNLAAFQRQTIRQSPSLHTIYTCCAPVPCRFLEERRLVCNVCTFSSKASEHNQPVNLRTRGRCDHLRTSLPHVRLTSASLFSRRPFMKIGNSLFEHIQGLVEIPARVVKMNGNYLPRSTLHFVLVVNGSTAFEVSTESFTYHLLEYSDALTQRKISFLFVQHSVSPFAKLVFPRFIHLRRHVVSSFSFVSVNM